MSEEKALPFNEEFQEAIVGHCMITPKFFIRCYGRLRAEWFSKNIMLGAIFQQLCKYYENDERFILSTDEFKNFEFFLEQANDDKEKYYALIDRCIISAKNFLLEKIERQLTGFLRVSLFKESIEGAARLYKNRGFDEAYQWTQQRLNDLRDASFEDDKNILTFEAYDEWIGKQEKRSERAISTGNAVIDECLGGGLFKKEACCIMAPVNVGKTTTMMTVARHAVWARQNVLFLLHEGDPEEIRLRFVCNFLGISRKTVFAWHKDPQRRMLIKFASEWLNRHLTIVPYIKTGGMFVEDVVQLIKKLNEDKKVKSPDGRGFDLIVDDYPKKLRSRLRSNSKEGIYRAELAEIYDSFNHLSTEIDVHCLTAAQTNRTGLKMNNNKLEADHLLGMEEIDEAYGIAQNMPNIITLNRSSEDKHSNILRINIPKSRNYVTDIAIHTRTNYECFLTFGDRDMFNGLPTELKAGYLASYRQDHNGKTPTNDVDLELIKKESGYIDENVGHATLSGKIET